MPGVPHFADRADAGRRLAAAIAGVLPEDATTVVLGLARGGIPVAAEVARALGGRLDALVVRKVGHPRQPEYALGAVSEDGVVLPEGLPPAAVEEQLERARSQAAALRGDQAAEPVAGRTAIIVDDGLATGRSMATALESVSRRGAARVAVAVPVAAGPALRALEEHCVETYAVGVVEPPEFLAVGQFYDDFAQVGDAAVTALLRGSTPRSDP
jgi:putative phosphoribosyl transferase